MMKALSIVAPSGTKIATGKKTLEIRRWKPTLKPNEDLLIVQNTRFLREEGEIDHDGKAVAIVKVGMVRPYVEADIDAACANSFEEGWLAWELFEVRPVSYSKPVLAARGIYEIPLNLDQL